MTRGVAGMAVVVDHEPWLGRPRSLVASLGADPMLVEAALSPPPKGADITCSEQARTFDKIPVKDHAPGSRCWGMVKRALDEDFNMVAGQPECWAIDPLNGPSFLFMPSILTASCAGPSAFSQCIDDCLMAGGRETPTCHLLPQVDDVQPTWEGAADDVVEPAVINTDSPKARTSVNSFIAKYNKPLEQAILSTPCLRSTKQATSTDGDDWIPKRSARLAAKSKFRENKPDAQARKVMMRRLGLVVDTVHTDEASFQEFQSAFAEPLTPSRREAMDILFPGRKQRALRVVEAV